MLNRAQPPGFGVGRSELYRGDSSSREESAYRAAAHFARVNRPMPSMRLAKRKKVDHGPMFVGYALLQSLIWLLCVPKTRTGCIGDEVRQEWDVIAACQSSERADARARPCPETSGCEFR